MYNRTYTQVGKQDGYEQEEINEAINKTRWEEFRRDNLPFSQGEAIKKIVTECRVPLKGIKRMDLHNVIKESHGFYALDVTYKNGQVQIYIADDGCAIRVVATDFQPIKQEV